MKALLQRVRALSAVVRGSLWFLPTLMTLGSVLLALATIWVDARIVTAEVANRLWFVFGVGPDGVRGVLSAIAGSIITVTGVVFSITVVALQLASTQYSPRVLRTFLTDRSTHVVLGVFISTFTYSLLILRTVRGESDELGQFVPSVSVTVALVLGLVSVGCLIFFVHHIAQSIRAAVIIDRLTSDALHTARKDFPRYVGRAAGAESWPGDASLAAWTVTTDRHGYLEMVDAGGLASLAELAGSGPVVLAMQAQIGDFLRTGDPLAAVRSAPGADRDAIAARVRASLPMGTEPTGEQDITRSVTRLSDVAIKALSPGINDPATASSCLDAISEVLVVLGNAEEVEPRRVIVDGCVFLETRRPRFDELAAVAFGGARHHGANDPRMCIKLLRTALAVGRRVPESERRTMLDEARLIARAAEQRIENEDEKTQVREEAQCVLAVLGG